MNERSKTRIIVAEDYMHTRDLIVTTLEREGYDIVDTAKDGLEALDKYSMFTPDLITLDIDMPHKTGLEVTKELRTKYPNAKILLISGYDSLRMQALTLGANEFLAKPFSQAQLVNSVRLTLASKNEDAPTPEVKEHISEPVNLWADTPYTPKPADIESLSQCEYRSDPPNSIPEPTDHDHTPFQSDPFFIHADETIHPTREEFAFDDLWKPVEDPSFITAPDETEGDKLWDFNVKPPQAEHIPVISDEESDEELIVETVEGVTIISGDDDDDLLSGNYTYVSPKPKVETPVYEERAAVTESVEVETVPTEDEFFLVTPPVVPRVEDESRGQGSRRVPDDLKSGDFAILSPTIETWSQQESEEEVIIAPPLTSVPNVTRTSLKYDQAHIEAPVDISPPIQSYSDDDQDILEIIPWEEPENKQNFFSRLFSRKTPRETKSKKKTKNKKKEG